MIVGLIKVGMFSLTANGLVRVVTLIAAIYLFGKGIAKASRLGGVRTSDLKGGRQDRAVSGHVAWIRVLGLMFWLCYLLRLHWNTAFQLEDGTNSYMVYLAYSVLSVSCFLAGTSLRLVSLKYLVIGCSVGGAVVALSTLVFQGEIVREYGRAMSAETGDTTHGLDIAGATLNPLTVAYSATVSLVVGISRLCNPRISNLWSLAFSLVLVLTGLMGLALGSSRGASLGLAVAMIVIARSTLGSKIGLSMRSLGIMCLLGVTLLVTIAYTGSSLLDRIVVTTEEQLSGYTDSRLDYWRAAYQQFLKHPIVGSYIEIPTLGTYPHNIVLESLVAIGILGTLFLVVLLWLGLEIAFKERSEDFEIVAIKAMFLVVFVGSLLSGAIYASLSFWLFLGALISIGSSKRYRLKESTARISSKGKVKRRNERVFSSMRR